MVLSGAAGVFVAYADEDDSGKEYYVAFSHQNYAIRNSNKMTLRDDGCYYLDKVSLSSAIGFYVTDNRGVRYYSVRGENMQVDETPAYRYNIKFSPDGIFDIGQDGYKATGCHVTYAFYTPESYGVEIDGVQNVLTYNPYFTAYDLYYISSVAIAGGSEVVYGEEKHVITDGGAYRILFTPKVVRDGNEYAFNSDGLYGSGEEYVYNVYIEDAAEYFAVFEEGVTVISDSSATQINGKDAYALCRYEQNTTAEEYRFGELFIPERDTALKYRVYERELTGGYRLIDDDNDEDTDVSKITVEDVGWYELSFTVGSEIYRTSAEWRERLLDGYYIVGSFNGYGFNKQGGVDIDKKFSFTEVGDGDDDYDDGYRQYILYLTVTDRDISDGNLEFYITDGKDKYKDGLKYICLNTSGVYKILFSDEHVYSQGRHYRYTLTDRTQAGREIEISTVKEFIAFAENCSASADYSVNLSVYLTCDLDFGGINFVGVRSFGGNFYGGYHTLKNITVTDRSDVFAVFECVTRTGNIERLNFENLTIDCKDGEYVGAVARNYGSLKRISVSGKITGDNFVGGVTAFNGVSRIDDNSASLDSNNVVQVGVVRDCKNSATVRGKSNVGGVVGFNSGDVLSCENKGAVAPCTQTNSNLTNIGAIAGFSAGKLSDCINRGAVGVKANAVYVGGIVGFCTGENYFCANFGEISGRKYVGGVIGGYGNIAENQGDGNEFFGGLELSEIINRYFNNGGTQDEVLIGERHGLIYLQNYGNVNSDNYAGGVVGNSLFDGLIIRNSLSAGDITCISGGYVGGILGNGTASVVGCFSSGTLKAGGANANYVGGIVGNGGTVHYCASNATLFGSDFVGGIAGNIANIISSSYSNTVIVCDGKNVGGIAGGAQSFNLSLNSFPDGFEYNYYIGTRGGIGGTEYGQNFEYAAVGISAEELLSENNLSMYLHEYFNHEYWQGGAKNSFPVLTYMYDCYDTEDIDDEEELFAKHTQNMQSAMSECAKLTYSVVFMEWNKDAGDLYEDGSINFDNFEEIYSVRVEKGASAECSSLKYAELKNGRWIYEGTDGVYFVTISAAENVEGNTVIYANYTLSISTLSTADADVLVEGLFDAETQITLERTGDYYSVKFTLDGEYIDAGHYTVKFRIPSENAEYTVYAVDGERTRLEASVYGGYICFEVDSGLFEICQSTAHSLSVLEIVLISVLSAAVVAATVVVIVFAVKRKRNKN